MTCEQKKTLWGRWILDLGVWFCLSGGLLAAPADPATTPAEPLWNIAWITDTQTPECEVITRLCERVVGDHPKMVIHTGDTRFEWANQCAWKDVVSLCRSEPVPIEFHLAPGNHDLDNEKLKPHLRRAAVGGVYLLDTGQKVEGKGYYHKRITAEASGEEWSPWNPEVVSLPAWQPDAGKIPYRYVFKRGGIRFIVCDCYYSDEQRDWVRDLITRPDDSSATIILQHRHEVDDLARYVEGLEGKHNVKLVLSGDHHNYCYEERYGVTFITAAGMARGHFGDSDAMTLRVFPDRLQLDRYLIPQGDTINEIEGPVTIWSCEGQFGTYDPPAWPAATGVAKVDMAEGGVDVRTFGSNLIYNGGFDNGVWYERFRGWSPAGWYQWFTCGDDAPEHTVGKDLHHSAKEYVRIHMWAHAWRGGILQNVRDIEPCHWYRLRAYGWFAKTADDPQADARVGLDPCGQLREQYSVDVTKHPAPAYNECVGDDPKTPDADWPDIPDTTVWSKHDYYNTWGRYEVTAEARSDVVTAILYCDPKQRPDDKPIYEMNWDTVSLYEVPWPTKRLVGDDAEMPVADEVKPPIVTVQPELNTAQVAWRTKVPAGAVQVLYRFLDSDAVTNQPKAEKEPEKIRPSGFPYETPVVYARSDKSHGVEIENLAIPESAVEMQVVTLTRVAMDNECKTLCGPLERFKLR